MQKMQPRYRSRPGRPAARRTNKPLSICGSALLRACFHSLETRQTPNLHRKRSTTTTASVFPLLTIHPIQRPFASNPRQSPRVHARWVHVGNHEQAERSAAPALSSKMHQPRSMRNCRWILAFPTIRWACHHSGAAIDMSQMDHPPDQMAHRLRSKVSGLWWILVIQASMPAALREQPAFAPKLRIGRVSGPKRSSARPPCGENTPSLRS